MIRGIVCDFGGVLTSPMTASFLSWGEEVGIDLAQLGEAVQVVTDRDGAHPLFELECGRITEADFMRVLGEAVSELAGRAIPMHDFSERLWSGLSANEPMVALMVELKQAEYRMALLTNNVKEWGPLWRAKVPVDDIFELVVDSAYVGMRKPDPKIYELTLERFGLPAAECLFIDDFESNCDAARELGMQAVQYVDAEQAIRDVRSALQAG